MQAGKRISEYEDRPLEIIQSEEQTQERIKKNEQSWRDMWDTINFNNMCIMGISERQEREKREYLKKKFPNASQM